MNITASNLVAEYNRSLPEWNFIPGMEVKYTLPRMLLFAVGSRETNMTNEVGDGGHGHGVWQLDDRSHTIPPNFDNDVKAQCELAAQQLQALLNNYNGALVKACAAYNTGVSNVDAAIRDTGNPDAYTTGHDYGTDVAQRMLFLQTAFPIPTPSQPQRKKSKMFMASGKGPSGAGTYIVYDNGLAKKITTDFDRDEYTKIGVPGPVLISDEEFATYKAY